jgi:hypothetical protein
MNGSQIEDGSWSHPRAVNPEESIETGFCFYFKVYRV